MKRLELNGRWTVRSEGQRKRLAATVPGCVQTDLLAAGLIPAAFPPDAAADLHWIARACWIYEREFVVDFDLPAAVRLRCEGLATCATLLLNDRVVGRADNMHRTWEFDLLPSLRKGRNRLEVRLEAPPGDDAAGTSPGAAAPRTKRLCQHCGPLAPALSPRGIWREIALLAGDTARLAEVRFRQEHAADVVVLEVGVTAERFDPQAVLETAVRLSYKGALVSEGRATLSDGRATLRLPIRNPQLWWPNGLGEQPLYEARVDLLDGCHQVLDEQTRRIGLRTLASAGNPGAAGGAAPFAVNGVPLFLRGAHWHPADFFVSRPTRVEYARLIKAAAMANLNLLHVWGGGIYEHDCFYDLCDEYGLCVWQDFLFASPPPRDDAASLDNVLIECEQNVCRLRHHPALAFWSGDAAPAPPAQPREPDAPTPIDAQLPELLARLDPERRGLADIPRIADLTGTLGSPLPAATTGATPDWRAPLLHALATQRAVERLRCRQPRGSGVLYGQIDACRPAAHCASLDHAGQWQALHYLVRRCYQPLLVCGIADAASGIVEIHVANDTRQPFAGDVRWQVAQTNGTPCRQNGRAIRLAAGSALRLGVLKMHDLVRSVGAAHLLVWLSLHDEHDKCVATHCVSFVPHDQILLPDPQVRAEIRPWDENSFAVTLTARQPALWVWLAVAETAAKFDDNFVCLQPNQPARIRVTPAERLKDASFRERLRVQSLHDIGVGMPAAQ